MKKSIRNKINHIITISIITLSVVMIGVNLVITSKYAGYSAETMMQKSCEVQALQLNNQFQLVEQSVQNIYYIAESVRPALSELQSIKKADSFINRFEKTAVTIANNTEGAIAVYYRMNPDLNRNGKQGFFYVKSPETGKFEPSPSTDLNDYDVNDVEHVGWYYIPVWAGKAVWMEPYYNANINVDMISYVVPVYDGVQLVGVIGMDVDFGRILDIAENVNIYESSGAVLMSMSNSKVYYNQCDIWGGKIPSDLYHELQGHEKTEKMMAYYQNGTQYMIHYETLKNRMKLILYAESKDINRQAVISMLISGIIFVVVFGLTLLVSMRVSRRITGPIQNITEAAKRYATGDWDAKVSCDTDDELAVLTENISVMAEKTKEYISYINNMAKKDGLTGLRNKMDYLQYVERVQNEYVGTDKNFAIAVFDVNNLKTVNDQFGHEKGDALIIAASKFICKSFSHSPVFRTGGDEFVAIIDSDDYGNRLELLDDFRRYMNLTKGIKDGSDVCIACGMATYGEDGSNFDEIFQMADQRMYENKVELKGGEKPR